MWNLRQSDGDLKLEREDESCSLREVRHDEHTCPHSQWGHLKTRAGRALFIPRGLSMADLFYSLDRR